MREVLQAAAVVAAAAEARTVVAAAAAVAAAADIVVDAAPAAPAVPGADRLSTTLPWAEPERCGESRPKCSRQTPAEHSVGKGRCKPVTPTVNDRLGLRRPVLLQCLRGSGPRRTRQGDFCHANAAHDRKRGREGHVKETGR